MDEIRKKRLISVDSGKIVREYSKKRGCAMDVKMRLLTLLDDMSEEELTRMLNFATEIIEAEEKELEEHAPVAFWDNDDKVWNDISR